MTLTPDEHGEQLRRELQSRRPHQPRRLLPDPDEHVRVAVLLLTA